MSSLNPDATSEGERDFRARTNTLPVAGSGGIGPAWFPDGRHFAYVEAGNRGAPLAEVRVSRIEDDEVISITDGRTSAWSPVWSSDERYLYFVSNLVGGMDLWRRRMRDGRPEGEPERVSAGIGMTSAAFSPDGKKLAYSRGRTVSNVWRVPILRERPATWADAQQITFDDAFIESLDVSPDGRRIAVDSDRAGNADLWILQTDGGPMTQFTTDATPDWSPAWSPDGEEIGFYAFRSGNRQVWVQPVTSGTARQLTKR